MGGRSRGGTLTVIAVVTCVIGSVALSGACQDPTQVTLSIETNARCADLKGVNIIVGKEPRETEDRAITRFASTVTDACTPSPSGNGGHIGTLVVTPGEDRGSILVIAGFLSPASSCVPPLYQGCIVARRTFAFIDHASLRLPITLDPSCVDVPCDLNSTCSTNRQCVRSTVQCNQSGGDCTEPGLLSDGGQEIVDTGIPIPPLADSGSDGGNPSGIIDAGRPDTGDGGGVVLGDGGPFTPLPTTTANQFGQCDPTKALFCVAPIQCNAQAPCCFVPSTSTDNPMCEMAGACLGSTACCVNSLNCATGMFCCAKLNVTTNRVHMGCALPPDCLGEHPPAYVCTTPGGVAEQCPPTHPTCTSVPVFGTMLIRRCAL
jgi:hypothetical protein